MRESARNRWVVAAATLALVLAGCLSETQPKEVRKAVRVHGSAAGGVMPWAEAERPVYSLEKVVPFSVRASDGVALRGHVYLPNGTGPFATVLQLSPYWNTQASFGHSESQDITKDGRRTVGRWLTPFMDAGFALALINLRGTGESDGCLQWNSKTDWSDAVSVIEALAAQSWSNGNIGMFGLSYDAWSQYMALAGGAPPALKAIVPVSGVMDPWNLWMRHRAPLQTAATYYPIFIGPIASGTLMATDPAGYAARPGDTNPTHYACPQYVPELLMNEEYMVGGDRNAYWQAQDLRPAIAKSQVPIFFTNGMTNGEGHILQFDGLWDLIPTQDKRMLVGQWGHAYPGGASSLASSVRPDFPDMAVAWFDHYLQGGPQLVEPGVVEYQDTDKVWYAVDAWPPPSTKVPVYLSQNKILLDKEEVQASSQRFQSDYRNPGIQECLPHPYQALYVSPPLANDVHLHGYFQLNLTLTSTLPDGNLAAFLFHTTGSGACPDPAAKEVRRALYSLRHVRTEAGEDFPVNTPTAISVQSYPFATKVPAGSRLVLAVGGDSPSLAPEPRKPLLTISTGPNLAGQIALPVVEGQLEFAAG